MARRRIGIALGSGAARGWAHIGVLRALEEADLAPDVVAGSSVGAVVGGLYAAGELDAFEHWVRRLDWRQVVGTLDLSFRGGLIKARKVFELLDARFPDREIAALGRPFGAVATDLATGREIWIREGSLMEALRASVAIPGLVTPALRDGRWLVDGGLVNPVPVSLCRALGADAVIAVDLGTTLLGRRLRGTAGALPATEPGPEAAEIAAEEGESEAPGAGTAYARSRSVRGALLELAGDLRRRLGRDEGDEREAPGVGERADAPSLYEVIANALNIMQVRVARSRMAGDPPDLLVAPQLANFALFDFDRGAEAIDEGYRAASGVLAARGQVLASGA